MTNIPYVQEGNVELVHHSTSSLIQIIVTDEEKMKSHVYFDYYDFDNLVKVVEVFLGKKFETK